MSASAELVPMGTITSQLGQRIEVGDGPKGTRLLVDVTSVEVESDRLRASLAATDAADWLTVGSDRTVGCTERRLKRKSPIRAAGEALFWGRYRLLVCRSVRHASIVDHC